MLKRKLEIEARKKELRSSIETLGGSELDAAIAEMDKMDKELAEIEKRNAVLARLSSVEDVSSRIIQKPTAGEERSYGVDSVEYRSAFFKSLQGKELSDVEKRAAISTSANSAGAVIPTTTMDKIITKMKTTGKMLPLITQMRIPSNVVMPIENATNDASWVSEGSSASDSSDTLDKLTLGAFKLIKTISITAEMSAMSVDAFEDFIVNMLFNRIEKALEYSVLRGNGTSQAKGIITSLTGTSQDITSVSTNTLSYEDIQRQDALLAEGYEENAYYILNKKTLRERISLIKDDNGKPIFKIETDEKNKKRINGYPVLLTANMPDDVVLLGDPAAYFLNLVKDFVVEKDKSVGFRSGDECYRMLGLADGKLGLNEAFVMLSVAS